MVLFFKRYRTLTAFAKNGTVRLWKWYHLRFLMSVHDELVALCRDMHAAGDQLTYAALLKRRGGGSKRDIAAALRSWRRENREVPRPAPGRPSRAEVHLRGTVQRQQATIRDQDEQIRILQEEVASLERMVRRYRAYPEDELYFEEPK
jgi:hypothetical protein